MKKCISTSFVFHLKFKAMGMSTPNLPIRDKQQEKQTKSFHIIHYSCIWKKFIKFSSSSLMTVILKI